MGSGCQTSIGVGITEFGIVMGKKKIVSTFCRLSLSRVWVKNFNDALDLKWKSHLEHFERAPIPSCSAELLLLSKILLETSQTQWTLWNFGLWPKFAKQHILCFANFCVIQLYEIGLSQIVSPSKPQPVMDLTRGVFECMHGHPVLSTVCSKLRQASKWATQISNPA